MGRSASIALFSLIVALVEHSWVRVAGVLVAMVTLVRAVASPPGGHRSGRCSPIAFLAFVLTVSVRMLVTVPRPPASG